MKYTIAILILLLPPLGCVPEAESNVQIYQAGRKLLLTYRVDMRNDGVIGDSSTTLGDKTVEEVYRGSYSEWGEMELPVSVKASDEPDRLALSLTYRRQRMGNWYKDDKGRKHEETFDSNRPPPKDERAIREHRERTEEMKSLSFLAHVNRAGKIVEFDASGEGFESAKKDLAASEATPAMKQWVAMAYHSGGVCSALNDAAAYLPPADARKGQKWHVRREYVIPYHAYGFYMLTNGCVYSTEESQCQVKSLRGTLAGRVMTIAITGRRVPQNPEKGTPIRVKHFELSGQLRVNLDTGEIIELQLKSITRPVSSKDQIIAGVKLIQSVKLGPLSE